jgi:hypothetical protein
MLDDDDNRDLPSRYYLASECDYTCSLRIDGNQIDAAAIDSCLAAPGEFATVPIRLNGRVTGERFERWEFEAISAAGGDQWTSLADAFNRAADALMPAQAVIRGEAARANAYWWCGCFHNEPESAIRLTPDTMEKLSRFGAPVILDNYFPDTGDVDPSADAAKASSFAPIENNHEYTFTVVGHDDAPRKVTPEASTAQGLWSEFGKGLSAVLDGLVDGGTDAPIEIVCRHIQFAFDGGPRIEPAHLEALSKAKVALTIVWGHERPCSPNPQEHAVN